MVGLIENTTGNFRLEICKNPTKEELQRIIKEDVKIGIIHTDG